MGRVEDLKHAKASDPEIAQLCSEIEHLYRDWREQRRWIDEVSVAIGIPMGVDRASASRIARYHRKLAKESK
jgi:hypothetical protein